MRTIEYWFIALAFLSGTAGATTPISRVVYLTILFEKSSAHVDRIGREKISVILRKILDEDWCPVVNGIVNGDAGSDEGNDAEQKNLAALRMENVKRILGELGFPVSHTYGTVRSRFVNSQHGDHLGPQVEIRFDGFPGHLNCSIPKNLHGFRLSN